MFVFPFRFRSRTAARTRVRRCAAAALAASIFLLPASALAERCADAIASLQEGEDGGYLEPGLTMPDVVLGVPRGGGSFSQSLDVYSLGHGGQITLAFEDNAIVDGSGPDFRVFENAFHTSNTGETTFREAGIVEASADGLTFHRFPWNAATFAGLAGVSPVHSHPETAIDPLHPDAGGDAFDLADIGLEEARYIRILDAADLVDDEGNNFPIRGQGKAGFDLDAIVALNSRETCAGCCDASFDGALGADDLVRLLRRADGLSASDVCGASPCRETMCGDTDGDDDLDRDDVWLCLDRSLGGDAPCAPRACDLDTPRTSITGTTAIAGRVQNTAASLEIPGPGTIQSGIGIVSGWKCEAGEITARFDNGDALPVAWGTPRRDTEPICGDRNNAFVMQWNYANLPDGEHTLRLYDDGTEFASSTFTVQTMGTKFLRSEDISGQQEFVLTSFPDPTQAAGVMLRWHGETQSFGIAGRIDVPDAAATRAQGWIDVPEVAATRAQGRALSTAANVEIPQPGSTRSGIGIVSGWKCEGGTLTASFNGGEPLAVAYGTARRDTEPICGDEDNAFALQWNYALLGDGDHRLELFDDGVRFAAVDFSVATLGVPFLRGASGSYDLLHFPSSGDRVAVDWREAAQSFVVVDFEASASPTPAPSPTSTPTPTLAPTPAPTPAPSPEPTPSAETCTTLTLEAAANRNDLAGAVVEIHWPADLSLPWAGGDETIAARLAYPAAAISGFRGGGQHVQIGLAATSAFAGPLAEIELDCASGAIPPLSAFGCELSAADALGQSLAATCQLVIADTTN